MLLIDIDSILPHSRFMFSGRYSSHIQDFQDFIKRIVGMFRHLSFSKKQMWICETLKRIKIFDENDLGFFLDFLRYPGVFIDLLFIAEIL